MRNISFREFLKRQQLHRSLPEFLCELTPLQNREGCHLNGSRHVSWHTCTVLTILAGDWVLYPSVEYLAIAEFTGIFLSMASHYISLVCIGFQAILDLICVPCLQTITLILRRSRTGTVWFYTSTSIKRAARPKLYTKSLTRDLKLMYSRLTLVRISINL